ncbi:MAG: uroporphyrinogen decarboxylase family protein [Candidatus Humimicrobiaceae bacterium]
MAFLHKNSREVIFSIINKKKAARIPWTLDFGSCKGIQWNLMERFKSSLNISQSLPKYFDYDIWMTLDPDRIHNDSTEYLPEFFKKIISKTSLIGGMPISKHEDFNYSQYYGSRILPEDGFFDGFGLYNYPWKGNEEYYSFLSPLENINDIKAIKEYPLPVLKKEHYKFFKNDIEFIKSNNKICSDYSGSFYEWSYYLRGREKIYYDYYDNPEIIKLIIEKVAFFVEDLSMKNINAGVDILCFYDDLGSQNGLQISPEIFRKFYKPYYKNLWQKIKSDYNDKYIFLHSCGNIAEIIPDLIECGLDILHPIQPETMNIYDIVREYKDDLVFWGTMSNQKTFPSGSREDIIKEVKDRVSNIGSQSGLILGSSNTLGKDVPIENINYFVEECRINCE